MIQSANTLQAGQGVLSLHNITLPVHLGVTEEEQKTPQNVTINVKIHLPSQLSVYTTDTLEDTICYYEVLCAIEKLLESKSFHLLEHLCYKIHNTVKLLVQNDTYTAPVWVKVQKTYPPIAHKLEGASFEYSDIG